MLEKWYRRLFWAPIALFVYNRPDHVKRTIQALKNNFGAKESVLYIFSDGPKSKKDLKGVNTVRKIIDRTDGFKKVVVVKSKVNKGLASSIIAGVTLLIKKHSRVIVVEDDLVSSKNFLLFMNKMLCVYRKNRKVFSITGYVYPFKIPEDYSFDVFFHHRFSSWGWATWRDRWTLADWDMKDFNSFSNNIGEIKKFNRGGSDLSKMLDNYMRGLNQSWAIRWAYCHYKNNGYCLFPVESKIFNTGNDGTGVHCTPTKRYDVILDSGKKFVFKLPKSVSVNKRISSNLMRLLSE